MKYYTMRVDATFSFTLAAESEDAAKVEAREMLTKYDPVTCGRFRLGFDDPFVSVAGADNQFPSLEAELDDVLTTEGSLI